jgi:uncharacterized membrane protein YfcA
MDTLFFHPKTVHIPIALGILMPLIAGCFVLAWWRKWLPPQTWFVAIGLQAILLGSGIIALRSGEVEEDRVEGQVPERFVEEHEEVAEGFVWTSGGVLTVMILAAVFASRKVGLPFAAAATLGTLVVLGFCYRTGQAGGNLVYQHGANQASVTDKASNGAEVGAVESDDD